jgi:hypothetical protein
MEYVPEIRTLRFSSLQYCAVRKQPDISAEHVAFVFRADDYMYAKQ